MKTIDFLEANPWVQDYRAVLPRHKARVWRRRDLDETLGMVWHQALSSADVESIAEYHVGPNHISEVGLASISYTLFIRPNGDTLLCNDLESITFSQGDATKKGDENRLYVAVCFGGNFDGQGYVGSDHVKAAQLYSGLRLWLAMQESFGWPDRNLFGHYHFGKPACPGTVLSQVIEAVRLGSPQTRYNFSLAEDRQEALQSLGFYDDVVDGVWGRNSKKALVAFQQHADIEVDGLWGPETERAIVKCLEG